MANSEKLDAYLIRRVKEMREQGASDYEIYQQLNACSSKKRLRELIGIDEAFRKVQ